MPVNQNIHLDKSSSNLNKTQADLSNKQDVKTVN